MARVDHQTFEEAVAMNNSVPQGLSSSLFTTDMKKVFKWMGCVAAVTARVVLLGVIGFDDLL